MRFLNYITLLLTTVTVLCGQTYQEKIVAAVLTAEAATEGKRGMLAVAEVVNQRSKDKNKTPYQVVTAGKGRKRAFSCLNGTTPDKLFVRRSKEPNYPVALGVSLTLCREPAKLTRMTNRATHYTRKEEKPYWSKGKRPVATIGAHAFYRLP
jgi:hypothetical protein